MQTVVAVHRLSKAAIQLQPAGHLADLQRASPNSAAGRLFSQDKCCELLTYVAYGGCSVCICSLSGTGLEMTLSITKLPVLIVSNFRTPKTILLIANFFFPWLWATS